MCSETGRVRGERKDKGERVRLERGWDRCVLKQEESGGKGKRKERE